jgi:signal transduction histidine kinase
MAVAEVAGYACWDLLSLLPIYPDRPLLGHSSAGVRRAALSDIGLIVVLALTPFVFLIAYGFQAGGLPGAAAWSLSTMGLHFMLKRLNERRLMVEEQNRRLETLNRELEHRERLSAIGKMSSVVSHQILQQLGVIGIYADLIRNADAAGEPAGALAQARDNAGAIEGALRDVNRVLTDLLVFSKDLRINLYEHPLARVIEECVDECRAEAVERTVALRVACPTTLNVTLDKLKMKQVLVNILRNAIEVSPPAGEVVVCAAQRNGGVEVAVSDQGPGVPERDREAVFTPFFTTKEHGTGLGLAIARQFTEAHGGRLWVEGNSGTPGATFVVRLPLGDA